METDELFQSLIRLKENLQEISSANRLVQDTVEAYRAVEAELAPAVKALGELPLEQKSLADGVQKRMDDALSLFAQDVKDIKEELASTAKSFAGATAQTSRQLAEEATTSLQQLVSSAHNKLEATLQQFAQEVGAVKSDLETTTKRFTEISELSSTQFTERATSTLQQLADNAEAATAHLETVFLKSQQQFAATLEKSSQSYDERSGSALQMLQAASVAITREIEAERKAIDLVKEELMGRYQALREQIVQIAEELGVSLGKQIADQRAYTGQVGEQLAQQLREQGATLREEFVNQNAQLRRQARFIRLLLFVVIALTIGMIALTALR
jgi:hypothetical protein